MKVSIIALTWNREALTKKTFEHNLKNAGHDYELLICDQGSNTKEFKDYLRSLNPTYLRLNAYNEGIARALNQLIIRAKGEHVFFMPNDIIFDSNWLKILLQYADDVPYSGIVGFEGQDLILPELEIKSHSGRIYKIRCNTDPSDLDKSQVLGASLFTRSLLKSIGGFDEKFHPYGFEDQDYNFRSKISGHLNYYVPGLKSKHLGLEREQNPAIYKEAKEFSFWSNIGYLRWKANNYYFAGIYEPFPTLREANA